MSVFVRAFFLFKFNDMLLFGRPNWPRHGACPSVCPSVPLSICLYVTHGLLVTCKQKCSKKGVSVSQAGVSGVPVFSSRHGRSRSLDVKQEAQTNRWLDLHRAENQNSQSVCGSEIFCRSRSASWHSVIRTSYPFIEFT